MSDGLLTTGELYTWGEEGLSILRIPKVMFATGESFSF